MLHEWETPEGRVRQKQEARLDYKQEIGSEVEVFRDLEDRVMGLHPSSSMKHKFWESRNVNGSDSVTQN